MRGLADWSGKGDPVEPRTAARAAQVRAGVVPALIGMAAVTIVLAFVAWVVAPVTDPVVFWPWLGFTALAPLGVYLAAAASRFRRPGDVEVVRLWLPFGRGIRTLLNFGVIASPWVLLPAAEPLLRALMLMLYVWFVATEVLTNPDPHGMTWVACFGVPMSLGLFLLRYHAAYALALTAFLGLTGVSLFVLGQFIQRGRERAFEARLALAAAQAAPPASPTPLIFAAALPVPRDGLTPRQIEVLRLLAAGQSNKDIARVLGVSPATVKTHVAQVIAITGATNRTGASMRAASLGLL